MNHLAARVADAALEATVVGSFSNVGIHLRSRLFAWDEPPNAAGRTVVVTGATSGLGLAAARRLAASGAHVVLVGRDDDRLDQARETVGAADAVSVARADLGELADVRALAGALERDHPSIDGLIHNAGALLDRYTLTSEGREATVATHVLGPFLLTATLLPNLRRAHGRVLTMASGGMYTERLDVAHLTMEASEYRGSVAYARAKRAQVELTREWARRVPGSEVLFLAVHPGWADTPGVATALPRFRQVMGPLLRTPEEGADTIVWAATTPLPPDSSGTFWHDRRKRRTSWFPWTATPAGEADRLWAWCAAQTGIS
jgi:NAD(P)-dependent dehydrogenase (short-subunit alcohol dehydrogenase family)